MRVPTNTLFKNIQQYLRSNTTALSKAQEQVTTLKRINRLSDDVVGSVRLLDTRVAQERVTTHLSNIGQLSDNAGVLDTTLGDSSDLLARARELMVRESSEATSTPISRQATRTEILSIIDQLVSLGNTQQNGQYIFGGFRNDQPAFTSASVNVS